MYPLAEGCFAPRKQWYIAAWSNEIGREPIERWILNVPLVFYRKQDGTPVALDGKCPHRGYPLGRSRLVGDNIECSYHGLTFQPDGSCVRIPSQSAIPKVCMVRSYPLLERWKWIWIWMGDPASADASLIPDHFALGLTDPSCHAAGDCYHEVPGRYMLMHDNLFDLTHLNYLHKATIAAPQSPDTVPVQKSGPGWISSYFEFRNVECPAWHGQMLGYEGNVDRRFGLKLHLPCLHVGFDEFRRVSERADVEGEPIGTFRIYHAITPATLHTAHYFFAMGHTWAHDDPQFAQKMVESLRPTIIEDMSAADFIEQMIQRSGRDPSEVLLRADEVCVRGRRMFEALIRAEQT